MNELFNDLPDVLDAKALAHALSISKSGAYTLLNQKDFPTLRIGGRKLVTKPDLICWMDKHIPINMVGKRRSILMSKYLEKKAHQY